MHIGKHLQNKGALLTGGAAGLGAETVKIFAAHGAVVISADVQDEQGEKLGREVNASGGKVFYRRLDVVDEAYWRNHVEEPVNAY